MMALGKFLSSDTRKAQIFIHEMNYVMCRPVVSGCAMAYPDFGRSVNPIATSGARTDYAHLITTGTPGFSDLPTALSLRLFQTIEYLEGKIGSCFFHF